jgi:DNA-binding NarL/FixJ family response regulator
MNERLLLVEDHVMVRQSIRNFIEDAGLQVIGEAGTGADAVRMAGELAPDLIIMDIHLPDMNGIEAVRRIHRQRPDIRIIALTAYNEKAYRQALHDAGGQAFVLKTAELAELLTVILSVIALDAPPRTRSSKPKAEPDFRLSERELSILRCTARGWTNKQIGNYLDISDRTVQVHLQAVYGKMDVSSRTEAVSRAIALGMIPIINGESS